jgi:hypothetical protein
MPRDPSGTYSTPVGTDGIPNFPIESSKYNTSTHDVETDLNTPRPIVAGGTGAANATDAMMNLRGDVAYQVVTNYDAYLFVSGTFSSAAGATSAPTTNAFTGICYASDPTVTPPAVPPSANLFIEARDQITGLKYVRNKTAGVWGSWLLQPGSSADLDAAYVNVSGDTMTGALKISYANPQMQLNKPVDTQAAQLIGANNNKARWTIEMANAIAESGSNAGSNFSISRYDDAGNFLGTPLSIIRNTGVASFTQNLAVGVGAATGAVQFGNNSANYLNYDGTKYTLSSGGLNVIGDINAQRVGSPTQGQYSFGNSGTKTLLFDGGNFVLNGAPLVVNASINTATTATQGIIGFGTSGNKFLQFDGGNFVFVGGGLVSVSPVYSASNTTDGVFGFGTGGANYLQYTNASKFYLSNAVSIGGSVASTGSVASSGTCIRAGLSGTSGGSVYNFNWTGSALQAWIDSTNLGIVTITSDYRIKKDVIDLPGMWDTVKALRPIKYTQAQFSPPSHMEHMEQSREDQDTPPVEHLFLADDIERWGFIAHELQETLTPSAASGVKDAYDTIQTPNPFTLIAALTKALQEAMVRIEVLEGTK